LFDRFVALTIDAVKELIINVHGLLDVHVIEADLEVAFLVIDRDAVGCDAN
jgi:hypothetical protein